MSIPNDQTTDKHHSGPGVIARLFWMFFGNAILFISIIFIFEHEDGMFHTADAVFWITVVALVFVRYLDIKFCGGLTATGLPASMSHWIKYTILLLICSTAVWALAHAVNYLVVNR
jgi:hypothetical protein